MAQQTANTVTVQEGNFLDRFPWYAQLAILLVVVLLLCFAADYFLFKSYRDEAETKMQQVQTLKSQNAEAATVAQHIEEYEKTLADLNAHFDELKDRLPEQREVSAIFENVRALIEKNHLKLINYTTGADTPAQYYTAQSNSLLLAGSYPNIQALYQDLANYQRILNVTGITLEKAPDDLQSQGYSTRSSFTVTAFYISDANKAALEADAKAAAAPAPAPGAPPAPPK